MVNYREILRLKNLGYTQRQIAASVYSSRNTIREVLNAASKNNIKWPLDDSVTNEMLLATFYPDRLTATNPRKGPEYSYIHKELAKPGVNLSLLWSEYCDNCYAITTRHICTRSFVISTDIGQGLQKLPCV